MPKTISLQSINFQQDTPNTQDKLIIGKSKTFYFLEDKEHELYIIKDY